MTTGLRVIITKAGDVSAITTEPMRAVEPAEGEVRIKVAQMLTVQAERQRSAAS